MMQISHTGKYFEIKNLGECYDLYTQIDTLMLVDVISNSDNHKYMIIMII